MSEYDQENAPQSSPPLPPSSPPTSSLHSNTNKPRKPPSVTPRRFGRFFTPRNSHSSGSRGGRELRDITRNGSNRTIAPLTFDDVDERPAKRRRASPEPFQSSPPDANEQLLSSPCGRIAGDEEEQPDEQELEEEHVFPSRIRRAKTRSLYTFTSSAATTSHASTHRSWPNSLAHNFYTTPSLTHRFTHPESHQTVVPFSVAATNNSTLLAAGAEDGRVRILDTAPTTPHFSTPYLTFEPHTNAIMDLTFSSDDHLLATGSGDQTACVTDMRTQETLFALHEHTSSVKQVRWSPASNQILTTCSRDGTICIWDIRTPPSSALKMHTLERFASGLPRKLRPSHTIVPPSVPYSTYTSGHSSQPSTPSSSSRTLHPSITALTFLPSHPHLFVTATDASAHLSLWDVRMPSKRSHSTRSSAFSSPSTSPISTIDPPETHAKRNWGITALAVSAASKNIFAVCRDSNVYAYSTSHLALGGVPAYNHSSGRMANRRWVKERGGAEPIYALSHPSLRCGSFYVRAAVDAEGGMLATGSSDGVGVVFPTAEPRRRLLSPEGVEGQPDKDMPTYETGQALVGAHEREVSGVAFVKGVDRCDGRSEDAEVDEEDTEAQGETDGECENMSSAYAGGLVTLGDDCTARLWRCRRGMARNARRGHAGWGWAEGVSSDEEG